MDDDTKELLAKFVHAVQVIAENIERLGNAIDNKGDLCVHVTVEPSHDAFPVKVEREE